MHHPTPPLWENSDGQYDFTLLFQSSRFRRAVQNIYNTENEWQVIFVLDEWDFIFHQPFISENNKREFLLFLRNLLKDRPYVLLAYMTGILPIAKVISKIHHLRGG